MLLGVLIIILATLGLGILFSPFFREHREDSLPAWVPGILMGILLVPFVLYAGAKLLHSQISLSTLLLVGVLIGLAGFAKLNRKRKK